MRYTSEQMREVVTAWQQSGLSKKAFCHQQNIRYGTFHYWHKRLHQSPPCGGFTELRVEEPDSRFRFQIRFTSGARMMFEGEPSVSWLRELLR